MSAAVAAAAAAALSGRRSVTTSSSSVQNSSHQYHHNHHLYRSLSALEVPALPTMSRYESQKRRDWDSFVQYIKNHHHPLSKLSHIDGDHVVVFLRYLSQTKIQSSFDAIISRLRVAFEENGGSPETNPFCSRVVKLYLEEVKNGQAKDSA